MQSHGQVVKLCLRGIDLAASPADRGELFIRAARAAYSSLEENSERYANQAIREFTEAEDRAGLIRATTVLARILNDSSRGNESWELLEPLVVEAGDDAGSESVAQLARAFMLDGHTDKALEWSDVALSQAESEDNIPVFVDTIITKGVGLGLRHRIRESIILLEAGLDMAREHQLMAQKRRVLQNLGYVTASDTASDTPSREDLAEEKLEDARRLGDPRTLTEVRIEWAWNRFFAFDWEETDRILADIDPTSLPLPVEVQYWRVAHIRRMWAEDPAEALVERAALRDRLSGSGDTQAIAELASGRADDAFAERRFDEIYEIARTELPATTPLRLDLYWRMLSAVMLSDRSRLAESLELAEANPFRGRTADLYKHVFRAALAAVDGDASRAEAEWRRAHELTADCLPAAFQPLMLALAGHSLGSAHPYGLESGRRAYELFFERGAMTMLDVLSTGVFEPEEQAADTA